jgi:hypothetical protein
MHCADPEGSLRLTNDDPSQAKGVPKESPSQRTMKVPGEVSKLERRPFHVHPRTQESDLV